MSSKNIYVFILLIFGLEGLQGCSVVGYLNGNINDYKHITKEEISVDQLSNKEHAGKWFRLFLCSGKCLSVKLISVDDNESFSFEEYESNEILHIQKAEIEKIQLVTKPIRDRFKYTSIGILIDATIVTLCVLLIKRVTKK